MKSAEAESKIRFTPDQVDDFARLSSDFNPLHVDPEYARTGPFGRRIVHGVAAVLRLLGRAIGTAPAQLARARASFKSPVWLETDYEAWCTREGTELRLELKQGSAVCIEADLELAKNPTPKESLSLEKPGFQPARSARLYPWTTDREVLPPRGYALASSTGSKIEQALGAPAPCLPLSQLSALCWASYFIGMECPGQQALFSMLEMEFEPAAGSSHEIRIAEITLERFERFKLVQVSGAASELRSFTLQSLERPLPAG
jgi:hypothetical protein